MAILCSYTCNDDQFFTVVPDIQVDPKENTVTASNTVMFTCMVTAKPQVLVYWTRNEVVLNESMQYLITSTVTGNCSSGSTSQCVSSSTLQILNTRVVDSGEYTCVAINVAGNDSTSILLDVHGNIDCHNIYLIA